MAISNVVPSVSSAPIGAVELVFSRGTLNDYFTVGNSTQIVANLPPGQYVLDVKTSEALTNSLAFISEGKDVLTVPVTTSTTRTFFVEELPLESVRITYVNPDWTSRTSGYGAHILQASTYGGNQTNGNVYLLGSNGAGIKTSSDGITWASRTAPFNVVLSAAFGKGVWVIGGNTNQLATSTDTITWTSRDATIGGENYADIIYGNGLFVGIGSQGSVRTSTDGITWATSSYVGSGGINGGTYGNGTYVVVGGSGFIATSTNGITWATRQSATGTQLLDVAYGANVFVAVGVSGIIRTSTDGITWTSTAIVAASNLAKVKYIGTGFIAGTIDGGIVTSVSGVNWTTRSANMGTTGITTITYGNGLVLLGGANGTLRTLKSSQSQLTQIYTSVTT